MRKNRIFAMLWAMIVALAAFGCKTETETEWKDKTFCSAVTFTSQAIEGGVKVAMATVTEGAAIYYTTDGTVPTEKSKKYSEAIEFTEDVTVKAIAIKDGIENSPVSVAAVSIKEKTIVETKTEYVDKKADETAPADVTELAAQAKDSRVLLIWTDAADDDVYGYEVTYSGTNPINRVVLPALDSKTMMAGKGAGGCYVSGLENGTEYTFTVKTVDTSGNKSEGVNVKATPVAVDASETLKIELAAAVPQENGYTGNKSNTKVTVTAKITTASKVKKVLWKKNGSLIAKQLLADNEAEVAASTEDNAVWTFDITAADETANCTYTVAAIDEAGREEAEQITINNFDFAAPGKVKVTNAVYSSELSSIIINWTEPDDTDYDHVDITFTSNDGTADSEPSQHVTVKKGTLNKTFSSIDGEKAYYTYTFVTYDELGNKSEEYKYKVSVNAAVINVPEGFVEIPAASITGSETWTPASNVFVSGRVVNLKSFWMSDHEVTQAEWKDVMETIPSGMAPADGNADNNPVNYVSWYDAIVYCNRRSIKEGLTPCYAINGSTDPASWGNVPTSSNATWNAATCDFTADGYRLPTEVEWEWAARGGENYTYAGSNNIDEVAWYTENTNDTGTREVKTKEANGYSLYDMSGNVWEWCWDWYDSISSTTPEAGVSSGSNRCRRGGSWLDLSYFCSVAYRHSISPYSRSSRLGFRLVRSAQ